MAYINCKVLEKPLVVWGVIMTGDKCHVFPQYMRLLFTFIEKHTLETVSVMI